MRPFRSALVVSFALLAVAGSAQTPAPSRTGPSPLDVITAPAAHTGTTVSWVVRFKSLLIDFAPDRTVENDRVVYEWRDETGAWPGRSIIAPPIKQTRWTEAAVIRAEGMFGAEPRLLTGTVRGVETATDAGGKAYVAVVLDDVTVDVLPLTPKTRLMEPGTVEGAYAPGQGVSWPIVVSEAKPDYPDAAKAARIEGPVELEVIVREDGTVGDVRVVKSLDRNQHGLDLAAVEAARKWRFKPGTKDGQPVPTRVGLILEFKLVK